MTNKQRAAARKVFRQFPELEPVKDGETITPSRDGVLGQPVEITDTMTEPQVEAALKVSCRAAMNG